MVIQLEDCVDVLKAIYGDKFDYCFLFDHSNGHDRQRPDGLNVNKVSKYYGGKQPSMRDSEIQNDSYLGPYNHPRILRVGEVQKMTWTDNGEGLYYMSNEMRQEKKIDKSEGKTREVDLTVDEMIVSLRRVGVNDKGKRDDLVKYAVTITSH